MKKTSALFIALIMVFGLLLVGCNNKKKETSTQTKIAVLENNETFTINKKAESFYVMCIGENLVRRPGSADAVFADDPEDLPELEDGQIAYVTADVRDEGSSFGFRPTHTYYITNLISVEIKTYEEILQTCNVPALDSGDNDGFYWYRHNDILYFIVLRDNVYAYTDEGKFTEYDRPRYANELFDQFLKEVEERG